MNENEDLICPYCNAVQQTHEPDEISALCCLTKCEKCDKEFWYSVRVTHNYEASPYDGVTI